MKKITEYPETEELKDSDKIFVNYNGALRQISKKELLRGVMEVIDGLTADDVGAADAEHEHAIADVPGLQEALNNKAASNHVHTQYASTNHTHTGYASTNHTHGLASANMAGFMSAADKEKLDGMSSGGSQIAVDSALSDTSENPVQNKVVTSAINKGNYYKCITAASSRVKEVKCPHFSFEEGAEITIEFYYGNTAENIDLSINGTVKGIALSSCNGGAVPKNLIKEGGVYTFRYTTDHGLFILSSYISRITDSSAITEKKAYALDAIEKNASIQGTMANEIAKLNTYVPLEIVTSSNTAGGTRHAYRIGNVCQVYGYVVMPSAGESILAFTIPDAMPIEQTIFSLTSISGVCAIGRIETTGEVLVSLPSSCAAVGMVFNFTYITAS